MTPKLILASASPRRADVLRQLGLSPAVRTSGVAETEVEGETSEQHVERLARAKAERVAQTEPHALVVGGDTVVVADGRVLGKPASEREAVEMLISLSARSHTVLSGLALAGPHGVVSAVSRTEVRFRAVDPPAAGRYVATGEPLDKAGAYGIQGMGAALVESVDGDYYAVVGFPVSTFITLLGEAGWRYDFGSLHPREAR